MFAWLAYVVYVLKMEDCTGINTWLTQKAMARILGTSQQNISSHVRNIIAENGKYYAIFVRTMKSSFSEKKAKKYYHQIILELIAKRIRTIPSKEFLEKIHNYRSKPNLKLNLIAE
jgi:hypothetical protein